MINVGDLVIVRKDHPSAGEAGVVVKVSSGLAAEKQDLVNVLWDSGATYWIEKKLLEVVHKMHNRKV